MYVTSRSPYHLPNFSHPTALHAPTTSINTKPFGPILKYIETLFIHVQSLIGIASQPKPLTVRRPTVSDSGSRSSPHSVQRSLHRRDIPLWKFADYSPDPDPGHMSRCWGSKPRGCDSLYCLTDLAIVAAIHVFLLIFLCTVGCRGSADVF